MILELIWLRILYVLKGRSKELLNREQILLESRLQLINISLQVKPKPTQVSHEIFEDGLEGRIKAKQAKCRHLKGGRLNNHKDHALRFFTFIDGSKDIKCLLCSKTWLPEDPEWDKALTMFEESSNTPNSSEVPIIRSAVMPNDWPSYQNGDGSLNIGNENPTRGRKFPK